ncbi:MAG: hypothetical protein OXE04_01015 [bacterium]|nr:hypothetical protein [bacterium]
MDDYLSRAEIAESARKHGVTDEDIRHALRYHWITLSADDLAVVMHVGPSMTSQPLEIGVLHKSHVRVIIHAMPARRRFLNKRR